MEIVKNYKPVLKNEVLVNYDNIASIFSQNRVYVLGYGSLLYSDGWKGRWMAEPPRRKDLIECELSGFERGPWGYFMPYNYYGLIRKRQSKIVGVLAHIKTLRDWASLMRTEHIAGLTLTVNYRVVDVTNSVECDQLPNTSVVHVVCNRPNNEDKVQGWFSRPSPWYYERVWDGVMRERSPKFIKRFLSTGGFKSAMDVEKFLKERRT